jgi:small subunit ribosomal protein S4
MEKCSFDRRSYPPGQHGTRRSKPTEYGIQLREKQKAKRIYGILENQFSLYFKKAERQKGITADNLLSLLEQRLDNAVFRLGFATSRSAARQLVRHNHFTVNGKKTNIPSYLIKKNDVIEVRFESKDVKCISEFLKQRSEKSIPSWLQLDKDNLKGTVLSLPRREDIHLPIQEQLIVELYSR